VAGGLGRETRPRVSAAAVSVVIPTRDRPAALADALASVLAQSHADLEVWIVDDGSAEPVGLPAPLGRDPRVHLLRLPRSQGPAYARNAGVAASSSALLAFLDDDDRWRPHALAALLAALGAADSDVAMVDGGFELWDRGRVVHRHVPDARRNLRRRLLEHPAISPSTVLLRRSAFLALGGFEVTLRRVEDWDLWLRLTDRYRVEAVPRVITDRTLQPVDPTVMLETYDSIVTRIALRLHDIAPAERRDVEAVHLFHRGVLLARAGRTADARATLWRAWRRRPGRWRPLLHLGRTAVGERAWTTAARVVRRVTPPR
jgi:hypothetical protein